MKMASDARRAGRIFALVVVLGGLAIVSAARGDESGDDKKAAKPEKPAKPPETLFEWAVQPRHLKNGEDKDKDEKENGNGENEKRPLESDRPEFPGVSTSTVGKGRVQLEMGYSFEREGGARQHSYPEALLRIGALAEWFEVRFAQNLSNARSEDFEPETTPNGFQDLYVGCKLALTEQKGRFPASAIVLYSYVPSGSPALTAGQMRPGGEYAMAWDLIKDRLKLTVSTEVVRQIDDSNHFFVEVTPTLSLDYELTHRLHLDMEFFAHCPIGGIDPGLGPEPYLHFFTTYLITENFQIDLRYAVGLNRHANDFVTGGGLAIRY